MEDAAKSLGLRMMEAARMAVALHLYESQESLREMGQRVVIGGAGPSMSREGQLSAAADRPGRWSQRGVDSSTSRHAEGGAG